MSSFAVTRNQKVSAAAATTVTVPQPAFMNAVPSLPYATEESPASRTTVYDDKTESSSVEVEKGGLIWEGYLEDDVPEKVHGHFLRNVRFQIFSLYRRLFGIVFVTNMAIFIAACVRGGVNTDANHLGLVTIGNLFVAILMRQAYVINAFFAVALWTPRSFVDMSLAPVTRRTVWANHLSQMATMGSEGHWAGLLHRWQ